jgi:hypothetical protein
VFKCKTDKDSSKEKQLMEIIICRAPEKEETKNKEVKDNNFKRALSVSVIIKKSNLKKITDKTIFLARMV